MQIIPASQYLTPEERKMLLQKNDVRAWFEVTTHWLWIIVAFTMVYFWTNPFTIILALFIFGGKQLACSILMHDAGHRSLFKKNQINDFVGNWLGAYLIFQDVRNYAKYHSVHHLNTGLTEDPDILLTRGYPTSRKSMFRKFFRDLTGQTGVKALIGIILIHLEYYEYNLGGKVVKIDQSQRSWSNFFITFYQNLFGPLLTQLILFTILSLIASPWLYLLWIGAYLTTFQFVIRIRSMAEHSMVENSTDPFANTRTTYANFLERLLFAPYYVNYHAEHHMLMGVPSYNLPKMHRLLKERGFYKKGVLESSYWSVIKLAVRE